MRNLVRFFWRYHYTFLFLVLQVIGFSMIVRFNQFHQSHFLNATQELSGTLYLAVNNVTEYIDLKRTNEELLAENAALREAFPEAFLDLRTTPVVTLDTVYQQQYEYIGAEVINNTTHLRNNFLTLNKGALAGLEAD
ncbi:MAG: rod shape-determining protein MreC, partial [Bacteroidota bacterium]